jgi:hypothetical protein
MSIQRLYAYQKLCFLIEAGIIFVIDSTDIVRMEVVKTELFTLLSHPGL